MFGLIFFAIAIGLCIVLKVVVFIMKAALEGYHIFAALATFVLVMVIAFVVVIFVEPTQVEENEPKQQTHISSSVDTETDEEHEFDGSSKYSPYVMWVDDFIKEIETDFNAAKAKYDGKWVSLIGVVKEEITGGSVCGYSLGPLSEELDNGMRFVFWCADGPYSNMDSIIQCFRGVVLEVSKDTTYIHVGEKVSS
jgi:hypothetical protein